MRKESVSIGYFKNKKTNKKRVTIFYVMFMKFSLEGMLCPIGL